MDIKEKNKEFLEILKNNSELRKKRDELVKGQHPDTLVITCSDSRVVPEIILNCSLGDIFVIRTAGNVINEGELATVAYAIKHLEIKRIIILGHTHCGAIQAAIHNEHVRFLGPTLRRIRKNIGIITSEEMAAKMNCIAEAYYLKEKFPDYAGTIESMIYDIETSEIF